MKPKFWKLSHGTEFFNRQAVNNGLNDRLAYVHNKTGGKGTSTYTQAEDFVSASIGDYFYLTHGNAGVYVLGQFAGPANIFSSMGDGWLDRPYRPIRSAISSATYNGPNKWWAPNHLSTFSPVPEHEHSQFEQHILEPFFDIRLADFGV